MAQVHFPDQKPISIHAPLTGSDAKTKIDWADAT